MPDDDAWSLDSLLTDALRRVGRDTRRLRGEHLFHLGQRPADMHFVLTGEVVLMRPGRGGEAVVLQRVRRGPLAEASLQTPRYHCDAVVTVDAQVASVPVDALRDALARDQAFNGRWIAMLAAELRRQRTQCERLSLRSVADRLLHLIETEGRDGRLKIASSLTSLSAELAVTHEALYRALARLQAAGRIERRPGEIRRLAPPAPAPQAPRSGRLGARPAGHAGAGRRSRA